MISGVDISVGDDLGRLLIVLSFVCSLPRLRQCAEMVLRIKWQLQTFFFFFVGLYPLI
jgi:hypothetical protein